MKNLFPLTAMFLILTLSGIAGNTGEAVPRVGQENVKPPVFTKRVAPEYPEQGLAIKLQGYVILEATLGRDGVVRDVVVLRSLGKGKLGFEDNAIAAIEQWEFLPGKVNGAPADVRMTLKIDFVLDGGSCKQPVLAWDAEGRNEDTTAPKVMAPQIKKDKKSSVARIEVVADLDSEGNLIALGIDEEALVAFAAPEEIRIRIEKILEKYTFEPAAQDGQGMDSTVRFMVPVPLNL